MRVFVFGVTLSSPVLTLLEGNKILTCPLFTQLNLVLVCMLLFHQKGRHYITGLNMSPISSKIYTLCKHNKYNFGQQRLV